jgi:DNA polymerase-3 subunit epsilon
MREDAIDQTLLHAIEGSADYRLLRRVEVKEGETGVGGRTGTSIGIALDVETTGIGEDDVIIELAIRRFRFDPDGVIVKIDRMYSWLEDPGREIAPDISKLTGLTDADLAGMSLDDDAATRLLRSAEFVVAHNARFDRGMIERRLPDLKDLAWACSCNDVDWRANGFEGRTLGWLLGQCGLFHEAHRAGDDVDGVIALLAHRLDAGPTVLAEMLRRARAPSWRFRAVGAAFEVKDVLRARGYRWDASPDAKAWWREVADEEREQEEWWLAGHVYSAEARPRALGPRIDRITWHERYS